MKRLIISGLSLLLTVGITALAVQAQEKTAYNPTTHGRTPSSVSQITPFDLVSQAYRGYFKSQGVPGYQSLITAYQGGQIDALSLVKSAIDDNKLSQSVLNDREYINAVDDNLKDLQLLGR